MTTPTETPLTDSAVCGYPLGEAVVFASFARALERRLAAAVESNDKRTGLLLNAKDKEIARITAQLEEARRDKERLDWLDGSGICDAGTVWARAKGLKYSQCSSLREAIDAAMQQKEGK